MKKRLITALLVSFIGLSMVFAGGKKEESSINTTNEVGGTLEVWGYASEIKTLALAYEEQHPDVKINFTLIPVAEYTTKIKAAISSGDVPDVICLEAAFVKNYVESDYLLNLNDLLPKAEELGTYQYLLDIGSYEGQTKAFSYQATPGALFYRRSLAKKYFGTDDPVEMQKILSNMDNFKKAAQVVHDKSDGKTFMVASSMDFQNLYYANRNTPWVVDGTLNIDDAVYEMIKTSKEFIDNDWEAQASPWSAGWYNGMNDSLTDSAGNEKQIFCYLLPTWGLSSILMENCEPKTSGGKTVGDSTFGDWACINGPMPYYWGGTWLAVLDESKNIATAKDFIQFSTLNEDTLSKWALGTYTNEYLKNIDPTIPDAQNQGAGDFVSSQVVVEKIKSKFDNSESSEFLSGQNAYAGFAKAAPYISLKLMQGTDGDVQNALGDPLEGYVEGSLSFEECIKAFKAAVRSSVPDVLIK
jgi:ABC-type glycerol-3-phosphate transport system substrate-binding protein